MRGEIFFYYVRNELPPSTYDFLLITFEIGACSWLHGIAARKVLIEISEIQRVWEGSYITGLMMLTTNIVRHNNGKIMN